ncbi:MAG: aquaporin family protein [Actinomycetota bacterium]|nr:aquaporin family protein [Actinomycetota bacterium]
MPDVKPVIPPLSRRLVAEGLGTSLLVTVVVGSGIAAQRLSPTDVGIQLLENSTATAFGLGVLILLFGPVSGAHFNPVVSAADWLLGRRTGSGLRGRDVAPYSIAQILGGISGAVLANLMYDLPAIQISANERSSDPVLLAEVVATAGLVTVIFALVRSGRAVLVAPAVGAYIGAAYWFTSSTSFANPAVTVGRIFSDTFAGIAPSSVTAFVLAQVVGGGLGVLLIRFLYPTVTGGPEDVTAHVASDRRGSDTRASDARDA